MDHLPTQTHPVLPGLPHPIYGSLHLSQSAPKVTSNSSDIPILASSASSLSATSASKDQTSPIDEFTSALLSGDADLALKLIANRNITVNTANSASGLLPLHIAASRGHVELVIALCEKAGAIIDLGDKEDEVSTVICCIL